MMYSKPITSRKQVFGSTIGLMLLLGFSFLARADVRLPAIIGDNMVLQTGMLAPIWGTADPGEKVTVSLGDQQTAATADNEGKWMVRLNPPDAGGPFEVTIAGSNTITLKNVLAGEVWVCSGQSNMQWSVNASANAEKEKAESEYHKIRLFSVKRVVADEPLQDTEGRWVECGTETVGVFSAVGYFFGRALHRELGVPIGLIHTSWGGTPAESWTSKPMLESDPVFKPILDRWEELMAKYPQAQKNYEEKLAQWEQDSQKAKDEGKRVPRKPWPPVGPGHPYKPSCLYNAMIAPLIPYTIKGAIWYQGESNAGKAYQYRKLFPAMIYDWRRSWGQGDFPFLFVQLANFTKILPEPGESNWAELREAQLMTLALPKTGMAVTIDIGEANDIHPKNKQDVGKRLALAALAVAYDEDLVYSGPIYKSMKIKGNRAVLSFYHVGGGLVAKDEEPLKGFAIAGQDFKFVWAEAEIKGNRVVVWSEKVQHPVAVRYGWADNPVCNLYNAEGLPASPFRTDQLPGVTTK
jgi:sialate O-acetylesterase